ncbi:MAG: hypothetical protein H6Q73_3894 [Firmicutes bacterium]|nr:hypothetical protein [Bacillota bacterium]
MLIWRGKGILTVVIAVVSTIVIQILVDAIWGQGASRGHTWPVALSMFIAAILNWFAGKHFNKNSERILLDPTTGQEVRVVSTHSLFWIRMEYWSVVGVALGLLMLIA